MKKALLAGLLLTISLVQPAVARADDTREQCLTGYEQGQSLTIDGKLRAARDQLMLCARASCPKLTQGDCGKWLAALEPRIPTVVVTATDAAGKDVETVRVLMDGNVLTERLDGRPIAVDPGAHAFRYEGEDTVVEERVVIVEGEKARRLAVKLAKAAPPPEPEQPPPPPPPHTIPTVAWVLGGVSVVAIGSFATFAIVGKSDEGCVPNCTRGEIDHFRRDYLIADVSVGVALVSAGLALYFALTNRPPVVSTPAANATAR